MTLADAYPAIKAAHVGLVALSGLFFATRGVGVFLGIGAATASRTRRTSVVIDTALLLAALLLLVALQLNPLTVHWLQMKLGLLAAYIWFGTLALRRARTRGGKVAAFVAALFCFGMMVVVALTHNPAGLLAVFEGTGL